MENHFLNGGLPLIEVFVLEQRVRGREFVTDWTGYDYIQCVKVEPSS